MFALGLGTLLNPLNSSMLAVALVTLRSELGVSAGEIAWVVTVFYLTSALAQPLMGRVADVVGPRRVFVGGMALVGIASAAAPLYPSLAVLCAMRILISVGTSTAHPSALAIIRHHSNDDVRSGIPEIAQIQLGNSMGVVLGPVLGGIILSLLSWQVLFWVSCPVSLCAMLVVHRFVPKDSAAITKGSWRKILSDLDLPGALLFGCVIIPILVSTTTSGSGPALALIGMGVVAAFAFYYRSLRLSDPFIDMTLVVNRRTLPIYVGFWLMTTAYYCIFYGLPQYLEVVMRFDPAQVGLLFSPLAAVAVVANPIVARTLMAYPVRRVLLVGTLWMAVAVAGLLVLSPEVSPTVVVLVSALLGVPHCIAVLGFNAAIYAASPAGRIGGASGLLQTGRHVGGSTAMVVVGLVFAAGVSFTALAELVVVTVAASLLAFAVMIFWRAGPERSRLSP